MDGVTMPLMRRRLFRGPTIQAALVLGFAATFGVWVFAGIQFAQRVAEAQQEAATVNARYTRAQELLSQVRTQVLLSSVYVRDALLDPDPVTLDAYRSQFEKAYAGAVDSLNRYVPVLGSAEEHGRIDSLRQELWHFHRASLDVLASDRALWATQARHLLTKRIMPHRNTLLQVSDEVQALNRASFVQQQRAIGDIYESTQQRIWQRLGVALAASLVIALAATLYVGRLEHDVRRRQRQEYRNSLDLQRLSAKLVTVQEEERRTIARELHDEVGQMLMAVKVELSMVRRAVEANRGTTRALDDAQSITDTALSTVRDLSRLLHPALLDDLGLPAAIEWYLGGMIKRHHIRIETSFDGMDDRLAPEIEAAFYRIVQEALTNVVKHAGATTCRVELRRRPETVVLVIEDDGAGFDPMHPHGDTEPGGLGLIGIRERVLQLAGSIQIDSKPGQGTRLRVTLPARPAPAPPDPTDVAAAGSTDVRFATELPHG